MVVRPLLDGERLYTHTAILFTPQLQTAAADAFAEGCQKPLLLLLLAQLEALKFCANANCVAGALTYSPLSTSASAANNYLARQGPYRQHKVSK